VYLIDEPECDGYSPALSMPVGCVFLAEADVSWNIPTNSAAAIATEHKIAPVRFKSENITPPLNIDV
jgi:hypothetical protein